MHPARLSFLAGKHSQIRNVISCNRIDNGSWELKLECGHEANCVAHMDASLSKTWSCRYCGLEYVKKAPQYKNEF